MAFIVEHVLKLNFVLFFLKDLTDEDEVTFCSSKCYVQFTIGKSTIAKTEPNELSSTTTPGSL